MSEHVIAVDLEDLRRIPMVVGVTSGRVRPRLGRRPAWRLHLDVLICDEAPPSPRLRSTRPRPAKEKKVCHDNAGVHARLFAASLGRADVSELAEAGLLAGLARSCAPTVTCHRPPQAPASPTYAAIAVKDGIITGSQVLEGIRGVRKAQARVADDRRRVEELTSGVLTNFEPRTAGALEHPRRCSKPRRRNRTPAPVAG